MGIRYIVTGGAGFIGSNLVAALNTRGIDDILVVDELGTDARWRNLVDLRYEDYIDKHAFRRAIADRGPVEAEAVLHMGACSATTEQDASYLADNNYRYTRELCEWALRNDIRFVYASSAATYGDGAQGYSDEVDLRVLRPLNMYGYSKQMFDRWADRRGLFDRIVGLKYFNVYGPREDHKADMRSMVHKAFGQIRHTGCVRLFKCHDGAYGHGEQDRDFLYVRDAVNMTLFFCDRPEVSGLFNCGTGRARTWNDLAHAVFAAMGVEPRIEYVDMPESIRHTYQNHTQAEMDKMRRAGYAEPMTPLEDGVREYVREYLAPRQPALP